jgi:hypothetical protein
MKKILTGFVAVTVIAMVGAWMHQSRAGKLHISSQEKGTFRDSANGPVDGPSSSDYDQDQLDRLTKVFLEAMPAGENTIAKINDVVKGIPNVPENKKNDPADIRTGVVVSQYGIYSVLSWDKKYIPTFGSDGKIAAWIAWNITGGGDESLYHTKDAKTETVGFLQKTPSAGFSDEQSHQMENGGTISEPKCNFKVNLNDSLFWQGFKIALSLHQPHVWQLQDFRHHTPDDYDFAVDEKLISAAIQKAVGMRLEEARGHAAQGSGLSALKSNIIGDDMKIFAGRLEAKEAQDSNMTVIPVQADKEPAK